MFEFFVLALVVFFPSLGFVGGMWTSRGRLAWGVVGSALAGFGMGAFLGSAGGAMATAVSSSEALWRGGALGTGVGVVVGCGLAAAWSIGRRRAERKETGRG